MTHKSCGRPYEMLMGTLPACDCVPLKERRPDLGLPWSDLIAKAIAQNPADRFEDAASMGAAVSALPEMASSVPSRGDHVPALAGTAEMQALQQILRESSDIVEVYRVTDCRDPYLGEGLRLYEAMIPENERGLNATECIRDFQDTIRFRALGEWQFDGHYFIAKWKAQVYGIVMLFTNPKESFAILSYVAVKKRNGLSRDCLLAFIFLKVSMILEDSKFGCLDEFFLELDDPQCTDDDGERRRRLTRIDRFSEVCQQHGRSLRFFAFDYHPTAMGTNIPHVGEEEPMLLGYASRERNSHVDGGMVCRVLRLIYTLNGECRIDDPSTEKHYHHYLDELCVSECVRVPARVQLLNNRQIREYIERGESYRFHEEPPSDTTETGNSIT